MIMQPWIKAEQETKKNLLMSVEVLEADRDKKKSIREIISDYELFNGMILWDKSEMQKVQDIVRAIIGISQNEIASMKNAQELRKEVRGRLKKFSEQDIDSICYILTAEFGEEEDEG